MLRLLKRCSGGENGQALAIVLALMAVGGLTIAVTLNYGVTSLKGSQGIGENVKGIYAAGAGIENALWSLRGGSLPPQELPESVNQMAVGIETLNQGTFTLYFGEMIDVSGAHADWLDVNGEISSTNISGRYEYSITVTWQAPQGKKIKLIEIGARLPVGFTYLSDSAASFPSNMSTDDPSSITTDSFGAYMLKWTWNPGQGPELSETQSVKTESFYITGTGSLGGTYPWVVAQSGDVGTVGEITGIRYRITSTATRPQDGKTSAQIVADAIIKDDGTVEVVSWQITK